MPVKEHEYTIEMFEQFLRLPENSRRLFELIQGEIVEKMPTEEHGLIAGNVITALNNFAKPRRLGRAGVEVRHQILHDMLNSRLPDVTFTVVRRPLVRQGSVAHMADLIVEIKSPDDTVRAMRAKADYYLTHGARLVWLVLPEKRLVEVYRLDEDVEIFDESDVLSGDDLLPGFTLPVADIFDDPFEE